MVKILDGHVSQGKHMINKFYCESFNSLSIHDDDDAEFNTGYKVSKDDGICMEGKDGIKMEEKPTLSSKSFIQFDNSIARGSNNEIITEDAIRKCKTVQGLISSGQISIQMTSWSQDADGDSILMVVIAMEHERVATQMIIISTPTQLNIQNKHGQTAAHVAACVNSKACLRKLIDYGADFTIVDKYGKTPLHIIAERGNADCILEMFRETMHTDTQVQRMLVKQLFMHDYQGYSPLHYAVVGGHFDAVKAFIRIKSNVCGKVATNGYEAIHLAVEQNNCELVNLLVTEGNASINAKSFSGVTPLHLAASYDNMGMVGLLIFLKADASLTTSENSLPMHFARSNTIIETLLSLSVPCSG